MATYHYRIVSAVLSVAGTIGLVAFATPSADIRTAAMAASTPVHVAV